MRLMQSSDSFEKQGRGVFVYNMSDTPNSR